MAARSRAVIFDGQVRVVDRPIPEPAPDEAVIRLRCAGICNTDLELTAGYKGFAGILGHEFVGDVVAGPDDWLGQRVVGEINIACGTCDMCQRNMPTHCRERAILGMQDYDGVFADHFRLPVRNLWRVPEKLPDERAVFTEPLAAASQVLECAHVPPSARVIVLGAGKLGLLVAQVLKQTGAHLSVVVRHARQAALLASWGIEAVERPTLPEGKADIVVDCTGQASGFDDALQLVRPRGTIVLKSTYAANPQANLTRIAVEELRVVGSRCGSFEPALRLLRDRLVDVASLIEARYTLGEARQAILHASQPGALKILLTP